MGIFLQKRTEDIEWIIWQLEESLENLKEHLSCSEISEELSKYKTDKRKAEILCSRILLKELFCEHFFY